MLSELHYSFMTMVKLWAKGFDKSTPCTSAPRAQDSRVVSTGLAFAFFNVCIFSLHQSVIEPIFIMSMGYYPSIGTLFKPLIFPFSRANIKITTLGDRKKHEASLHGGRRNAPATVIWLHQ